MQKRIKEKAKMKPAFTVPKGDTIDDMLNHYIN